MQNKTKPELIEIIEDLQSKVEQLENDVDYWQDEYNEKEEECDRLNEQIDEQSDGIKSVENLIWRLKLDNLYDNKIENFLNEYLRYYNE